jgi:hypothetical protein
MINISGHAGRGAPRRAATLLLALSTALAGLVLLTAPSAVASTPVQVGYRDFSFGTSPSAPTAKEVQSKLWFADGIWWGILYSSTAPKGYRIYRFDWPSQSWSATGLVVDTRPGARSDALWDGTHLYVASAGIRETTAGDAAMIRRFSYNSATKTYSLDPGYPVTISTNGMQAVVIAKDTTGTMWATWTQQSKVWVTHTTTSDQSWAPPYVLPAANSTGLLDQDESGVVSYNGKIGIMWGDQAPTSWGYYFAVHRDGDPDGVWQPMDAHKVSDEADNHINMKTLDGDPAGQVFAAVKTSLNGPNDPIYYLLVLRNDDTWQTYPLARVSDDWTRATVLIDRESRQIYVFGASPCCNGGVVYYKVSSLDNISFPVGQGTPLMQSGTDIHINNPTSTKQSVSSATGLLAIASDDSSRSYLHNSFGLGAGDTVPPNTTLDSAPVDPSFSSTATFGFSSNEAGATFSCSLDGGAFSSCPAPKTFTGLSDGSHTFQVRATDLAGNTDPTPASKTWTIDTSNPTLTLGADADSEVDSATPDANFGTVKSMTVDGSPNSEAYLRFGLNGITGTILEARLRVFATDATPDGPAVHLAGSGWTETGITWNNRPARTGGVVADTGGVTKNTWVEYDVTSAVTGDGTYTFDLAPESNDGMTANSREATTNKPQLVLIVRSDTSAPETAIGSGPSGSVGSGSASFGFSSNEPGSTFQCSLDGAAFVACASPKAYSGLADGSHTFAVDAVDAAGNVDATPASRTWTVDTVAPAAPVIGSPADGSVNGTGTVVLSGTAEPASSIAVFDATEQQGSVVAAGDGSWSVTLTAVADGAHSYTARATDAAGNVSAASAAIGVTVDTAAPDTQIDSGPTGAVTSTSASFAFSSSKAGSTFQCSLDGAASGACTSPTAYSGLAEGAHTFAVYAVDSLGHADATPATRTWTVDTTAPTVTSVSPADGVVGVAGSSSVSATFSEAMDGASLSALTFTVSTGGSPAPATVTYDSATRTATLAPQQILAPNAVYTAKVLGGSGGARDVAGNALATDMVWSFTTDQPDVTPPETAIGSGPSGSVGSGSASFGFSSNEPGSTFQCSLDGAAFVACTSPKAYSGLADGSHTFAVDAVDEAGNADATPASRTWTVDTVAPAAPVIGSPADGTVSGTGTVVISGTAEPASTVAVFDGASQMGTGAASGDGSWSVTLSGVADGGHSYTARATDAAGNVSAASAAVGVTVDTAAPQTAIDSGPTGTVLSRSASFAFSADKAGSTFQCSLDGAASGACTSPKAYSGLAEGAHTFAVYAVDSLGHADASPATRTWTVNLTMVSDGFESGGFAPTVWTVRTGADGTATVQTDTVKTGTYAARLAETANTGSLAYARAAFPAQDDLLLSGDFRVVAEGVSGGNVPLLRLFDASGTRLVSVYRQNLAGNKLYVQYGGTSFLATNTLPLNTWAHLELHVTAGAGSGAVELRLNGSPVYSSSTATLSGGFATLQLGNETAKQAFALVADNVSAVVPG